MNDEPQGTSETSLSSEPLFDYSFADFDNPLADLEGLHEINPHRGDMVQLDGVAFCEEDRAIGWKDVRDDEFWVPGHIPGRPLMPGVLMIEAAAQLSSFVIQTYRTPAERAKDFLGFVRSDKTIFRNQVIPGQRLIILARLESKNSRRFISLCQGFVDGNLVFETKVTGMHL
jgi:3-hydroxyacyl-[acyl-carrier-protein] dehydratase